MNERTPSEPALADLAARAAAAPRDAALQMAYGSALHAAGQRELALTVFEQCLALEPSSARTASACATLLFELGRPQAAYQVLAGAREQLLQDADGAANLAIAAEACGQTDEARAAYERALALDPQHLRAHNNLGLMAAREGRWDEALAHAQRCVELAPGVALLRVNLCDLLTASRDYPSALACLDEAIRHFPGAAELLVRRAIVLAFQARFDESQAAFAALGPQASALLKQFLDASALAADRPVRKTALVLPDAWELFTQQAFEALQQADWRDHDRLTLALRGTLARVSASGEARDWRDTQFYSLVLPLDEEEHATLRRVTIATIQSLVPQDAGWKGRPSPPLRGDGRLRIGIAAQSLADARYANSLQRQLALHDRSRFAIHIYSPTPRPEARHAEPLRPLAENIVEIAHMSDAEAARRIRLDRLDIWMDAAFYTPWCRPELPALRVAPVQLRSQTWHRIHQPLPCDYSVGDTFTHPDLHDTPRYGAIARFAHSCWLVTGDEAPDPEPVDRADAQLPQDALVLCALLPALMIDPGTFALWMQALRALPDAVLWLPAYGPAVRANLCREARAAGVEAHRLVFAARTPRPEMLARLKLADLFVDSLHFNANHGLVDALRMGVPAISCAGRTMASRLGGSIIRAAGLPECVHHDPGAWLEAAVALGRDRAALRALRARLHAARPAAPLFDAAARVREWEAAWTHMAQRQQAGLPPAAFDIPAPAGGPA
jgi:predicted O-linked N-acetylglucosamine transferase (SPINDLY family)